MAPLQQSLAVSQGTPTAEIVTIKVPRTVASAPASSSSRNWWGVTVVAPGPVMERGDRIISRMKNSGIPSESETLGLLSGSFQILRQPLINTLMQADARVSDDALFSKARLLLRSAYASINKWKTFSNDQSESDRQLLADTIRGGLGQTIYTELKQLLANPQRVDTSSLTKVLNHARQIDLASTHEIKLLPKALQQDLNRFSGSCSSIAKGQLNEILNSKHYRELPINLKEQCVRKMVVEKEDGIGNYHNLFLGRNCGNLNVSQNILLTTIFNACSRETRSNLSFAFQSSGGVRSAFENLGGSKAPMTLAVDSYLSSDGRAVDPKRRADILTQLAGAFLKNQQYASNVGTCSSTHTSYSFGDDYINGIMQRMRSGATLYQAHEAVRAEASFLGGATPPSRGPQDPEADSIYTQVPSTPRLLQRDGWTTEKGVHREAIIIVGSQNPGDPQNWFQNNAKRFKECLQAIYGANVKILTCPTAKEVEAACKEVGDRCGKYAKSQVLVSLFAHGSKGTQHDYGKTVAARHDGSIMLRGTANPPVDLTESALREMINNYLAPNATRVNLLANTCFGEVWTR